MNAAWHRAHRLGAKASITQRIEWHLEHSKACGCRPIPQSVQRAIEERKTIEPERSPARDRPKKPGF